MDPSIMKLLEEDEDESNYSGADVEAFTAALNRDIGGNASISQTADSDVGVLPERSNPTSNQLLGQLQTSNQEENITFQYQEKEEQHQLLPQEQESSQLEAMQHESGANNQNQHDQLLLQQKQSQDDRQHQQTEQTAVQFPQKGQLQTSEQNPVQHPEQDMCQHTKSRPQYSNPPQLIRQAPATDQANNPMRLNISFSSLIPFLRPHIDKDRAMQLHTIFTKLRSNEVSKEGFLRVVRNIVGDQMLRLAAHKVQMQFQQQAHTEGAQSSQTSSHLYHLQSHASAQQHMMSSCSTQKFTESPSFSQHHPASSTQHQKGHGSPTHLSQVPASTNHVQNDMGLPIPEDSAQKSKQTDTESDAKGLLVSQPSSTNIKTASQEREVSMVSQQAFNKQQQQMHLSPTFSMYGGAVSNHNAHTYSGSSVSVPAMNIKTQNQETRLRQVPHPQGMVSTQMGSSQPLSAMNETKRLHGGSLSHLTAQSSSSFASECNNQGIPVPSPSKDETIEKQSARMGLPTSASMVGTTLISGSAVDSSMQMRSLLPTAATTAGAGTNMRTPPKKPSAGQKRPLEAHGTSSPLSSKKQKVSGALLDQSIEQLNDVTAVSGVNLREEEEQLLSAPKEESRASEATRRVVQEEEERLILQKGPLQKKIAEIMSRSGINSTSNDVERCLSMVRSILTEPNFQSVEERLRGLISNLIRLSKQRVDIERSRHRIFITSDVRRQILLMNRKVKEDWEKKQAEEAEKLRKQNETEGNGDGVDVDMEKDEGRSKAPKANKEEDDKLRATAANVAARAAVGGDDMLSKWQLMAEQARQKREGAQDGASGAQPGKDPKGRSISATGRTLRDSQEDENKGTTSVSGPMRKFMRNQVVMPQTKIVRSIVIKDVIAALEREPQMSKSTLIHRLYERMHTDSVAE